MTLNPKYQRYADRLRELVEEGEAVAKLERPAHGVPPFIQDRDLIRLRAWLTNVYNIIDILFGAESSQHQMLEQLAKRGVEHSYKVYPIIGIVGGALDDVEKGFLTGQEFLIAAEVLDSLLEQAKHLNETGYKDPAAVLMRVVLEDALRRLAREESIDVSQKASALNIELRKIDRYSQPQWRIVEACLDTGNAAAHGKFDQYDQGDVERRIEDVERFLASEFRA